MPDKKKLWVRLWVWKRADEWKRKWRKNTVFIKTNGTWTEHINQHRETKTNKTVMIIMFYIQTNKIHTHIHTHTLTRMQTKKYTHYRVVIIYSNVVKKWTKTNLIIKEEKKTKSVTSVSVGRASLEGQ